MPPTDSVPRQRHRARFYKNFTCAIAYHMPRCFSQEHRPMRPDSRLLRIAAFCAALSALTTLIVHLGPGFLPEAPSFEARVALRENPLYMAYLWNYILHCLLVVVSMYAVRSIAPQGRTALSDLGFLAFVVFAFAETLRSSLAIFAVNRTWRVAYAGAADDAARERARSLLEGFAGIGEALFFVFFLAFFLGTVCYGLAFFRESGLTGGVGILFLVWAGLNLPALVETIAGTGVVSPYLEWVVPRFQAAARLVIGWWLFKSAAAAAAAASVPLAAVETPAPFSSSGRRTASR